jgi:hypothetical protein
MAAICQRTIRLTSGAFILVAMILKDFKDARALWHGSMPGESRQEIRRARRQPSTLPPRA